MFGVIVRLWATTGMIVDLNDANEFADWLLLLFVVVVAVIVDLDEFVSSGFRGERDSE